MPPLGPRRQAKPARRRTPSRQELKTARALAGGYASQGRAVEKQAQRQRAAARIQRRPQPKVVSTYRQAVKPTATQRARAQERAYKSQGRAVQQHATTDPALKEMEAYAGKTRAQKYAQLSQIKAKKPSERSLGEFNILRLHRGRHRADVKMLKTVGFLPRARYGYTPKPTKYNVVPATQDERVQRAAHAKALTRAHLRPGASQAERRKMVQTLSTSKGLEAFKTREALKTSARLAPAVNVLEQFSRPLYASSGAALALAEGKSAGKALEAAGRGLTLKDRHTYSEVLKAAGVKNKALRAVGGFVGDVALDPTTYVTFGTASIAKQAASKAALAAERAATRAATERLAGQVAAKQITKREARLVARREGKIAGAKAYRERIEKATPLEHRRVRRARVAGTRQAQKAGRAVRRRVVPAKTEQRLLEREPAMPYTRARAKGKEFQSRQAASLGRTLSKTERGRRTVERARTTRAALREGFSSLNARVRPPGMTEAQWERVQEIDRSRRALEGAITGRGAQRAVTIAKVITPEDGNVIRTAIERGDLESLKGIAPKITPRGLAKLDPAVRRLAKDPDRFYKIATSTGEEWRGLRQQLSDLGVPIGWVGEKPPVTIPTATADVKGAQQTLAKAHRSQRIAELEGLLHARPGAETGRLTEGQITRAEREGKRAQQAKQAAMADFQRYSRLADKAEDPAIAKRFRQRARAAKGRAAQAQTKLEHWSSVAGRPVRPTKSVHAPQRVHEEPMFHASRRGLGERGHETVSYEVHLGTRKAAADRAKAFKGDPHQMESYRLADDARRPKEGEKGSRSNPYTEAELGTLPPAKLAQAGVSPWRHQQALRELREQGLDAVYYRNEVEDPGKLSLLVLDRRRLTPAAETTPPLERVRAVAPPRAAIPTAKKRVREAKAALGAQKRQARVERRTIRRAQRLQAQRDLEAKGYFPRVRREVVEERGAVAELQDILEGGTTPRIAGPGSKKPRGTHAKARKYRAPVEQMAAKDAEQWSSDFGLVHQAYTSGMAKGIGRAHANRELIKEGRPVELGRSIESQLQPGEAVWHRHGADLTELDPKALGDAGKKARAQINSLEAGDVPKADEYVILPNAMARRIVDSTSHESQAFGRFFDRVMGRWKYVALGTPAYLVRNAASDLFAAYGAQNPAALARNYFKAQLTLNEKGRIERGYRNFEGEMEQLGKGTQTVVNGLPMRYRDLAFEAEAAGAIEGRVADLVDQLKRTRKFKGLERPRGSRAWDRMVTRVENSARLATYIGYRERGLAPEAAARKVAKIHFDYGALTAAEKQARRAMPFYTWTARNIPRQAELLVTKPGKLLAYEKARQEGIRALQGELPEDYVAGLDPYEARQLGIPLKLPGGQIATVSMGLPLTDLNDVVPSDLTSAKGWATLPFTTLTRRGVELAGPYKALPELVYNYSTFYRDDIEDPDAPRTPIPGPIEFLTRNNPALKKQLGIQPKRNKETGKVEESWPKRLDYAVRQSLPGVFGALWRAGYGDKKTARGFPHTLELAGSLTGLRAKPLDLETNELNKLYDRQKDLKARMQVYHDAGVYKDNPTGKTPPGVPPLTAEQKKRIRIQDFPKVEQELADVEKRINDINEGKRVLHKGRWKTKERVAGALGAERPLRLSDDVQLTGERPLRLAP